MKKLLALAFLLATASQAQEPPKQQSTEEGCQALLQGYAQIVIKAEQAELVSQVGKGVVQICQRLIAAEKKLEATKMKTEAAPTATPEGPQ